LGLLSISQLFVLTSASLDHSKSLILRFLVLALVRLRIIPELVLPAKIRSVKKTKKRESALSLQAQKLTSLSVLHADLISWGIQSIVA
jgi:hypothetical protein